MFDIISYSMFRESVRQLRESFYGSCGLKYAMWIFIRIRKLHSDNTVLSVSVTRSRNRRHRYGGGEHTALHAFVSTNQLKSRQESHDKCTRMRW